jgi:tetratricopeptide (TPR) repeat protein
MKACILGILFAFLLPAEDERQLALMLKAQSDFDRVELALRPSLAETDACVRSQAAALSVSSSMERPLLLYRKGFCTLAGAVAIRQSTQFMVAAAEFDKAIAAWPERVRKPVKNAVAEPVSSALRVYAAIARLQGSTGSEATAAATREISTALEPKACNSNLMSAQTCSDVLAAGSDWLGWMALRESRVDDAVRFLAAGTDSGWKKWAEGRREFDASRYSAAAVQYGAAIERWKRIWAGDGPTFRQAMGPRPRLPIALADYGAALMLAGDLTGAVATLNDSLQADPKNAHALFLRARAKELAGKKDEALTDYNLASRNAFAEAQDLASGEAHLYRGIVLFRRRDFERAEEEFATSLTFEMTDSLRPDARAWRQLAAISQGSCGQARDTLGQALATVSPFFPRDEARAAVAACGATSERR